MRITNKVMQNNALANINRNKELQDNLSTQLATGKKVNKPSEDPVVAIRALRLRSDVSQVSQYYKKNVPDAESWLELTESSIKTTVSVVKNMIEQCEKGSNDTLTTEDRKVVIDALKQLRDEVYATGNADYAGRYIFTGYRTDTPLTFTENTLKKYSITEMLPADKLEQMTYIGTKGASGASLLDVSESTFDGSYQMAEQDITSTDYYRVRLAYDNLDKTGATSIVITDKDGNILPVTTDIAAGDKESAYEQIANTTGNSALLVPSTGELLLSKDLYNAVKAGDATISYTYEKSNWVKNDLMPQHYFYCQDISDPTNVITYNGEDKNNDGTMDIYENGLADQAIEYQVGFGQHIRVNTTAGSVYQHDIGRDVDEIINLANYLTDVENMKKKLEDMSKNTDAYSEGEIENIKADLDAADKATAMLRDQLQKRFSKYISSTQSYLDDTDSALTTVGSQSARLQLISNRLDDQTTTFKTLQSENEDADATEVAVQLSSAQVSYEAALMATSEMIQKTLLNYL